MQQPRFIQREFNWEAAAEERNEDLVRDAFVGPCRTTEQTHANAYSSNIGELVRDILRPEDKSFDPVAFDRHVGHSLRMEDLPNITLRELSAISPIFGRAELQTLLSAIELGRRVAEAKSSKANTRTKITSSATAIEYCQTHFRRLAEDGKQEEFHILSLDTKNQVIASHLITVGTLNASLVHPREVFRPAIKDSAAAIITVHNHPSGDPTPSKEDRSVTRRLEECGKTLGIDALDHIVVAQSGAVSIRESI